ncbi:MAG: type II toxin-antitoxin system PemK/MazF family toxin [Bacillota bacterium]
MPLQYPPNRGEIVVGDFNNLLPNEMTKIRPCVVISPRYQTRSNLVTVVCLSTTEPDTIMDYHDKLEFNPPLSPKFSSRFMWIKGDMLYSISLTRINRPHIMLPNGKRDYPIRMLESEEMNKVMKCVLCGIGFKVDKNLNKV